MKMFRKIIIAVGVVVALLTFSFGFSQTLPPQVEALKKRVESNLKLVSNDFRLRERVQIDNTGIVLYDSIGGNVITSLDWVEVPKFLEIVENWDYYSMTEEFEKRGQSAFAHVDVDKLQLKYKELPSSWFGLTVVLDPGHFGGSMLEAKLEDRYATFRKEDVGTKEDVSFFESDLTYPTCELLKIYLEKKGCKVFITRPYGMSALGKKFEDWKNDDFKDDLEKAYVKHDVSRELYDALKDYPTDQFIFENFYKFLEFRKRVALINRVRPDVTIAVHYNSKEGSKRFGGRYLPPVKEDYSMVFVPGGFLDNEVSKTDQKIDFLRLLLSRDIDNSAKLGSEIIKTLGTTINVQPVPRVNGLRVLRDKSVFTGNDGVYSRNLVVTRMSRGMVVYVEGLYQDNINELKLLSLDDFSYEVDGMKRITSKRCNDVALAVTQGLENYLNSNKKK